MIDTGEFITKFKIYSRGFQPYLSQLFSGSVGWLKKRFLYLNPGHRVCNFCCIYVLFCCIYVLFCCIYVLFCAIWSYISHPLFSGRIFRGIILLRIPVEFRENNGRIPENLVRDWYNYCFIFFLPYKLLKSVDICMTILF